jgi:DHA2 family multidrug resistance protein
VTPFNQELLPYLAERGLDPYSPQAAPAIAYEIGRQAQMLAFNDLFWFIGIVTFAITPVLFFMTRPKDVSLVPAH